jgi:hypothetical protein
MGYNVEGGVTRWKPDKFGMNSPPCLSKPRNRSLT